MSDKEGIITDLDFLRQPSEPFKDPNDPEVELVLEAMSEVIGINTLGLAAPQVGFHKRMIFARLSHGIFVFVNPSIVPGISESSTQRSLEGCLSLDLPNGRCVMRKHQVTVEADRVMRVFREKGLYRVAEDMSDKVRKLKSRDACVIQHEIDHLDGVLLIDHPEVETYEELAAKKETERKRKKYMRKHSKRQQTFAQQPAAKKSVKKASKPKRRRRSKTKKNEDLEQESDQRPETPIADEKKEPEIEKRYNPLLQSEIRALVSQKRTQLRKFFAEK